MPVSGRQPPSVLLSQSQPGTRHTQQSDLPLVVGQEAQMEGKE
jgi:hypothetical protein